MKIKNSKNQEEQAFAFEKQILEVLYRSCCPEPEALLNFQWGLLSFEEMALVAAHLAECELCANEAGELAKPETAVTPSKSKPFTTQLQQLVQYFVAQLTPPTLAAAVLRSTPEQSDPLSTEHDRATNIFTVTELGWDIFLTHYPEPDMKCSLKGQLLGPSPAELKPLQISLIQDNQIIATTSPSQAGVFSFTKIACGLYSLSIVKDKETVTVSNFVLD